MTLRSFLFLGLSAALCSGGEQAIAQRIRDTSFHENGRIESVRIGRARSDFSGIVFHAVYFDSLTGRPIAAGREHSSMGRLGRWKIYEAGQAASTERYRLGVPRNELRDSACRRRLIYLAYGFGGGCGYDCEDEAFAMTCRSIGGCIVSNRMKRRAAVHNFFNDLRQTARFGRGWRKRYEAYDCPD